MSARVSQLARLQQFTTAWTWLGALAWWAGCVWLAGAWTAAWIGALAFVLTMPLLLALQFGVAWRINRAQMPAPTAAQMLHAWWSEVLTCCRVFWWRQPFGWDAVPDTTGEMGARRGMVLVHGFVCNRGLWTPWLERLRARGRPFIAVNLEPVFGSIDDYLPILARAVQALTEATGQPPVVVGHSMGGLVARAWLRSALALPVHHVVTIGTPHHGTWWARWSHTPNGRQMRQDSRWIAGLSTAQRPLPEGSATGWTCWYSNADNIVLPTPTATLAGADNRHLPGVGHVDLAFHPQVMEHAFGLLD